MKVTEKYNINVTDIEVMRMHYAHTLDYWYKNVMQHKKEIIKMFDEKFLRMWEYYLNYCETGFDVGTLDLIQIGVKNKKKITF